MKLQNNRDSTWMVKNNFFENWADKPSSIIPENTHCKGRYHCIGCLLFDLLGFWQTFKSVSYSTQVKLLSQTGGKPYNDTSTYKESECSLIIPWAFIFHLCYWTTWSSLVHLWFLFFKAYMETKRIKICHFFCFNIARLLVLRVY